jgi:3-methylcrotonyl-CoA carboxylase alpha subunit
MQSHIHSDVWEVSVGHNLYKYKATKDDSNLHIQTDDFVASYPYFENQDYAWYLNNNGLVKITKIKDDHGSVGDEHHAGDILAPMNGTIVTMKVHKGQAVEKDDLLVVVEAMKMEHSLRAPFAGVVADCFGEAGELVNGGSILVSLKHNEMGKEA